MTIRTRLASLLAVLSAGLFGLCLPAAAAADSSKLLSVEVQARTTELEVFLRVEGAWQFVFSELRDPSRLVVDFLGVEEVSASDLIPVRVFGLERIRTGQPQPGTARVVFEFASQAPLYLVNSTPQGVQILFLPGSGEKKAEPQPSAGRPSPPVPAEAPAPPPPTVETTMRPANMLFGVDVLNTTLDDHRFQHVFGHRTTPSLAVGFTRILFTFGRLALAVEAEYGRLALEGQSTITHQPTTVTLQSLNVGPRLFFRTGSFWPYVSARLFVCQYHENSPLHSTLGNEPGVSLQIGAYFGAPSLDLLKARLFVQWSKAVAQENGLKVELGGISIGAGLALSFNLF